MKVNMKTVQRFFTVSGVLVTVFVLMAALTPLSFAYDTPSDMIIDDYLPTLNDYPFGINTVLVDVIGGDSSNTNSGFRRFAVDGQSCTLTVGFGSSSYTACTLSLAAYGSEIWQYSFASGLSNMVDLDDYNAAVGSGIHYSARRVVGTFSLNSSTHTYVRTYTNTFYQSTATANQHIYVVVSRFISEGNDGVSTVCQAYYPDGLGGISDEALSRLYQKMDSNRDEIVSRYNEGVTEIVDAGSDVTVSTIDNWVGGNNGLAGKLTELAATLSSNADIFSQNQSQNQANLSKAGEFVGNVFNQIPTGITAAAVCFLIILIAVKVVGR